MYSASKKSWKVEKINEKALNYCIYVLLYLPCVVIGATCGSQPQNFFLVRSLARTQMAPASASQSRLAPSLVSSSIRCFPTVPGCQPPRPPCRHGESAFEGPVGGSRGLEEEDESLVRSRVRWLTGPRLLGGPEAQNWHRPLQILHWQLALKKKKSAM